MNRAVKNILRYQKYLWRDEFKTALAAGSINGTRCEPGPGLRTIVDTENKLSIADGRLTFAGGKASPAYGDPGYWKTEAITRKRGLIVAWKLNIADVTTSILLGVDTDKTGLISAHGIRIGGDVINAREDTTYSPNISIPIDATNTYIAIILRDSGAHFFAKIGTGNWKYLWSTVTNNTATLYAGISNYNAVGYADIIDQINYLWLPTPLLSDSFAGADGSADGRLSNGLGHAETTGLCSGGAGVAWSGATGSIVSNQLVITPSLAITEKAVDTGYETAYVSGLCGSLTKAGSPNVAESADAHGGSKAQQFTATATSDKLYQTAALGLSSANWYNFSVWAKRTSGSSGTVKIGSVSGQSIVSPTYEKLTYTFKPGSEPVDVRETGSSFDTVLIDDKSLKQITLSTCFQTTTLSTKDVELRAKFTMVTGTQCGIVFGMNEAGTYFGLLYHDGAGNVKLEINENGTWTTKATTAIAYSADTEIVIRRDDTVLACYYSNTLVGAAYPTTTLSAGENTNLAGLKVGAFSTSELNSFSSFVAHLSGTNGELNILDRLIGA